MKKLILLITSGIFFFTFSIYSQSRSEIKNTNLAVDAVNNYSNPIIKVSESMPGVNCVGGIIYDDNTFENGYGWNSGYGIGKFVMKFTPFNYPYTINQVCFALTRLTQGSANWTFDIVVYDTTGTGGSPGTLITSIPNQVATNVGVWPVLTWHDFTGLTTIPELTSGSYYVGLSWDPVEQGSHYIASDESPTTPLRECYGYIQSAWSLVSVNFPLVRALGIRCDGVGVQYAHNIAVGPFLSMPSLLNAYQTYAIKAKVRNAGTADEVTVPMKYFVNGVLTGSKTIPILNAGAVDSLSFLWTPTLAGDYVLKIVSALATDEYRANDTVTTSVHVYPSGTLFPCIGTDTNAVQYPFNTFYMDSRTDMLYLASEIGSGGLSATINMIGFNVTAALPQVMNGFKIKMQNTTATTITNFTSTGWTTVFDWAWAVPGTGLQWINLQTPFLYTGTNLLVEICFNNSSYTTSSQVKSTSAPGRIVHNHQDLASGDGCIDITTTSAVTLLPNICIGYHPGKIQSIQAGVPDKFSLSQNYPNPFNPSTNITYSIPKRSMLKLVIYDVLGKEIVTMVNEELTPGTYEAKWDGTNYPSGLYFYKLECGDFTDVKKMVLIK